MYQLHLLDAAIDDLARLDKTIARRIIKRLRWLAENLDNLRLETLTGNLLGFYKYSHIPAYWYLTDTIPVRDSICYLTMLSLPLVIVSVGSARNKKLEYDYKYSCQTLTLDSTKHQYAHPYHEVAFGFTGGVRDNEK